ncbi:hypothetical protein [Polaromonas sp. LjRoot131]|uniref:hypothetical protein n=1 Tax=Polaromonas sp. LjRoot131 TaxID=3342262 RepID=UPI003ECCAA9B
MTSLTQPTPQERLASSRKAIVRHMSRDKLSHDEQEQSGRHGEEGPEHAGSGSWGFIKHALGAWWQHHPVSAAFSLAQPVLGKYAREKPFQLLGIAAVAGAAAVAFKPWRLVSLGSVLLAALKSSEISGALLSMLSSPEQSSEQTQRTRP